MSVKSGMVSRKEFAGISTFVLSPLSWEVQADKQNTAMKINSSLQLIYYLQFMVFWPNRCCDNRQTLRIRIGSRSGRLQQPLPSSPCA